jgi:hypothetical protein
VPPEPVDAPAAFVMVNARALVPPPAVAAPVAFATVTARVVVPPLAVAAPLVLVSVTAKALVPPAAVAAPVTLATVKASVVAAAARGRRPGCVRDGDGEAAGAAPGGGRAGRVEQRDREGGRAAGRGGEAGVVGDVRVRARDGGPRPPLAPDVAGASHEYTAPRGLTSRAAGRLRRRRPDAATASGTTRPPRVVARRLFDDRPTVFDPTVAPILYSAPLPFVAVREREPGPAVDRARRLDRPAEEQVADRATPSPWWTGSLPSCRSRRWTLARVVGQARRLENSLITRSRSSAAAFTVIVTVSMVAADACSPRTVGSGSPWCSSPATTPAASTCSSGYR